MDFDKSCIFKSILFHCQNTYSLKTEGIKERILQFLRINLTTLPIYLSSAKLSIFLLQSSSLGENVLTTAYFFLEAKIGSDSQPKGVQLLSRVQLFATPWTVDTRLLCPWNFPGRIPEWVPISFCRGSSWPMDWTLVSGISCTGRQILYPLTHQGSPKLFLHYFKLFYF